MNQTQVLQNRTEPALLQQKGGAKGERLFRTHSPCQQTTTGSQFLRGCLTMEATRVLRKKVDKEGWTKECY